MATSFPGSSLDSLVVFESAVRHLNFTLVAEELGTSQPAVSQRIAALEKELGTPLFKRAHRGVSLTADGASLHEAVRDHLAAIRLAVDKVRTRRTRQVVTVATDFGCAQFWLMQRLAEFQKSRPELDVRIVTSQQAFDIRGEAVDLALSFGEDHWPGCDAEQILPELVVPVCSPSLMRLHREAGGTTPDVLGLPLLHLGSGGHTPWMTWQDWAQLQGLPPVSATQSLILGNYPLVIQAAIAGHGVALGWRPLVDALLHDGQLVSLPVPPLTTERGYFLVQPRGRERSDAVDTLRAWIADGASREK